MSDTDTDEYAEKAGGLDEILPESLVPIYERWKLIDQFRENHGDTYTGILEAIVGTILIAGYGYWLYLFFFAG